MKIRGAVLEASGRERPYASSVPLSISELDLDSPGAGEVLVRIEAAGLCHSDLSVVNGQRPRPVPMLLGHEAAGRVEAVGDGVTDIETGQRVVLVFVPSCGDCAGCRSEGRLPCVRGSAANEDGALLRGGSRLRRDGIPVRHHLGVSAFATHAVVDRGSVVPIEDDVPPEVAALLGCATLTGGGAVINAARVRPGETVMIVGLGGVGLAALLVSRAVGAGRVIAVDSLREKRTMALDLGADAALSPEELVAADVRADAVIEAAGIAAALESAIDATAPGGRTVSVGLAAPDAVATLSPLRLVAQARTVIGSYLGSSVPARDIPRYAQWWREGRLPIERLVSHRIPLDELNLAMDALADGRAVRQIVMPAEG